MEKRIMKYANGICYAKIDISVAEWKELLSNTEVFNEKSLTILKYWYSQLDCQATSKEIILQYNLKNTGEINGTVVNLGKRILGYLNRFEVVRENGENVYFIVPFECWYEDYNPNKYFVWKVRDELVQAIEELSLFEKHAPQNNEMLETLNIIETRPEGTKKVSYTTTYERNSQNRRLAIKIHGTKCQICGFDFEKIYGERGRGFIEVHHIKPLADNEKEVVINPKEDLICVCSNCHRMFHRKKDQVPTPEEMKKSIHP